MTIISQHPAIRIGDELAVIIDGDVRIYDTSDRQIRRVCTFTTDEKDALVKVYQEQRQADVYRPAA